MSAKTKIVVLRMRNIIFSGILIGVLILAAIIVITLIESRSDNKALDTPAGIFQPGVYTTSVALSGAAIDVSVTVDDNNINSIELTNLSESVETMYPLVEPTLEELVLQIIENQSTDNLTYSSNNQYTSMVLISAIDKALDKAKTSQ